MPGDPKECREHARRCAELAKAATTQEAREQFLSLQMSWIRLAADLDNAKAFIDALDEMDCRAAGQGRGVAARSRSEIRALMQSIAAAGEWSFPR